MEVFIFRHWTWTIYVRTHNRARELGALSDTIISWVIFILSNRECKQNVDHVVHDRSSAISPLDDNFNLSLCVYQNYADILSAAWHSLTWGVAFNSHITFAHVHRGSPWWFGWMSPINWRYVLVISINDVLPSNIVVSCHHNARYSCWSLSKFMSLIKYYNFNSCI